MTARWYRLGWTRAVLLLAGVNLVAFALYTLPALVEQERLAAVLAGQRTLVTKDRRIEQEWAHWRDVLGDNIRDENRLRTELLVPRAQVLGLQVAVYKVAIQVGLKPKERKYEFRDVKGVPYLKRMIIAMPITGSYRQVLSFLRQIESGPDFVVVDQLQLHGQERDEHALAVSLSAYYRGDRGEERP